MYVRLSLVSWLLAKSLFFIIVWVCFFYNFFSHVFLWTNLVCLSYKNPKTILPSFNILLKSFVIEFIYTFFSIILTFFNFLPKLQYKRQYQQSYKNSTLPITPILFIHGYLHHKFAWLWFIHKLEKQTKQQFTFFPINISPTLASIIDLSKLIKNQIIDIKNKTNSSKIILIGHSMGGILASYYCEYLAKPDEIAKVITIGSPFKGSCLASFGVGKSAQEMLPNSNFLNELNNRINKSNIPYFCIASTIDNIVIPWQSALLPENVEKNNTYILNDHGHLRYLISSRVVKQVINWIL